MGFRDAAQEPHLPAGNGAFRLQHVKRLRIIPVIGAVLDLLHPADVLLLQPPGVEHEIQHEPRHRQHQHNQQPGSLVVRAVVRGDDADDAGDLRAPGQEVEAGDVAAAGRREGHHRRHLQRGQGKGGDAAEGNAVGFPRTGRGSVQLLHHSSILQDAVFMGKGGSGPSVLPPFMLLRACPCPQAPCAGRDARRSCACGLPSRFRPHGSETDPQSCPSFC